MSQLSALPRKAVNNVSKPGRAPVSAPVAHDDIFTLLQIARFGACATRSDGTVVFWNRRAEQICGVSSSDALGRHYRELIPQRALRPSGAQEAFEAEEVAVQPPVLVAPQAGDVLTVYIFDDHHSGPAPGPAQPAAHLSEAELPTHDGGPPPLIGQPAPQLLTRREAQVLEMMAEGTPTDKIASELGISVHTVRNHVRNLRRKLNARSKPEAVANAFRQGLL